jgi:hydrogenase maturation protease
MVCLAAQSEATPTRVSPILILGLGNLLLRDEGFGVHVVQALQGMALPADVELYDGGTGGLALLDVLAQRDKVIVIDALESDDPPGTLWRIDGENLAAHHDVELSLHELGLPEILAAARRLGQAPRQLVVIGAVPRDIAAGLDLSDVLARQIPRVIQLVLAELPQPPRGAAQSSVLEDES